MTQSDIRAALIKRFVDGGFFTVDRISWENKAFKPPTSDGWAAVFFIPNPPDVASLGQMGLDRFTGILQIDLNYPLNSGEAEIVAMADNVRNSFTAGDRATYNDTEVLIRSCGRSQGRSVNNYWRVSVTVYFQADIQRQPL